MTENNQTGARDTSRAETTETRRYVKMVAAFAAIGGLLFGYDTGVMSGALLYISPEFGMSAAEEGRVTAMLLVGAAIGALLGGRVADWWGRRMTLLVNGVIFCAGSIWCALAGSVAELATARTFLGVAVGAVSIVVPMYIAEKVPAAVRGRMVSLNTLMIVVGQLLAYLVNSLLAPTGNWHLMLGMAAIPGAMLTAGMIFLSDTPVWLARKGRTDQAREVAARAGMSLEELSIVVEAEQLDDAGTAASGGAKTSEEFQALKKMRWIRVTILIAMLIGVTQQITGVNAVIYFAPTMMSEVGISTTNAVYTSIVIGVVSVIACWVGLKIIDVVGRKRLLTWGLTGNIISLLVLALTYSLADGSFTWAMVSLGLMAVFIAFQQAAVSPTTWLLISEIVPVQARGLGMGIAGLALWVANWAVAQFFLPVTEILSGSGTFVAFSMLGVVALGFVRVFIPETMGRSLEEVGEVMEKRWAK
ncbi:MULTISPECIES: sugar porter family MFS transporter [Corynebacterium]|uniref:Sugar porter family MFS transporter n=1 Tax=Corynebacterium pseudodiphtheriticum TaxID=37637 RepID=A0AAP4F614_9CORY|nr:MULTISPECIES: sugar porter family MFS transporter [Corynebacterium]MDC7113004.1 sugar porter family MFS transporter [Corynebacterium pseudodiphtheriticum]MDK4207634.1 sugar porter family MFS transporter [Corynebacterium pseudodiphtheriticum]MDK4229397.1 sugar porter family MFS transporter [Corynebacterium pseudodiphtheriticum]MDK4241591.1 sugar porter family MFS transporter [Corynebacterium pseudodiphtheriticum]MDK4250332.1 sugar porter family MFS transporter [Corynebacterium pseudodiphther